MVEAGSVGERAKTLLHAFWTWWRGELLALIPGRDPSRRRPADARLALGGGLIRVLDPDDSNGTAPATPGDTAASLADGPEPVRRIELVLDTDDCLVRRPTLPRVAAAQASGLLALELAQVTPFSVDEVWWGYRLDEAPGGWRATQAIVRRDQIAPILDAMAEKKIVVERLVVDEEDGPVEIALPAAHEVVRRQRLLNRAFAGLALLAVVAGAANLGLVRHRQSALTTELEGRVAAAATQARAVRERIAAVTGAIRSYETLRSRRAEHVALTRIMEAAAVRLPDTAWLTETRRSGDELYLGGLARSAPELLAALEASPVFSDASFAAPVTRAPQGDHERFLIRVRLRPDGERRAGL